MTSRAAFLQSAGTLVVAFAGGIAPANAADPVPGATPAALPAATIGGATYPNVDSWLALDRTGRVTILYGKVELGTGIETAISQLVADELDVPFGMVRVVQGDTDRAPDQGYTAGSQSLQSGAVPIRRASAQLRTILVGLAATRLGVPVEALDTRDGAVFVTANPSARAAYPLLIDPGADWPISPTVKLRAPSTYRVVGKPVPRVDLPAKLSGTFRYVQNVRVPGMVHARVLYPPRLGATASAVDTTGLGPLRQAVRVVRKGDFVAVVADREWDAVLGARRVRVDWTGGPPLPAPADLYRVVRETPGVARVLVDKGDVSATASPRAVRATYQWPFQSHGSIGPSCAVADVRAGGVTIWSGTQGTFPLKRSVAAMLGRDAADVRVNYVEAAGCYGHNGADDAAAAAVLVSQEIGRPVRVQYMRADETTWDPKGPAMVTDCAATLSDAGTIDAWSYQVWSPSHSGRPDGQPATLLPARLAGAPAAKPGYVGGDRNAPNNYDIPNQRVTIVYQPAAVIRHSALRGLGGTSNAFANESFADELAVAAKADPLAFRLKHLSDPRARAVLSAVQPYFRAGRGVAFTRYENTDAYVAAVVDLQVERATGAVSIKTVWVAHDCGLIVNPDGLRNQIEGNVIQAASRTLREEVAFDANGVTSKDWVSYPIFRFSDVPDVHVTLLDQPDAPIYGAGEATTTVMPPAIANAIFAQTGVRLRTAPFTPARVKAALA